MYRFPPEQEPQTAADPTRIAEQSLLQAQRAMPSVNDKSFRMHAGRLAYCRNLTACLHDLERRGVALPAGSLTGIGDGDFASLTAWHEAMRQRPARQPDPAALAAILRRQQRFTASLGDDLVSSRQTLEKAMAAFEAGRNPQRPAVAQTVQIYRPASPK